MILKRIEKFGDLFEKKYKKNLNSLIKEIKEREKNKSKKKIEIELKKGSYNTNFVEKEFCVIISEEDIEIKNFSSINNIMSLINRKSN